MSQSSYQAGIAVQIFQLGVEMRDLHDHIIMDTDPTSRALNLTDILRYKLLFYLSVILTFECYFQV